MAPPKTFTFGNFIVQVGDGAQPENFVAPCGFTDRSLELKADTATDQIPDCDDQDAPAWNSTGVKALSASVSGQGVLAASSHRTWREWLLSGVSRNVRVIVGNSAALNGGYYQGAAALTSFKMDGSFGEKTKITVQIDSDGEWTWVDAAA